jgi:UDP-glucose 4-epimerase
MRILLTGASGFIGGHILTSLIESIGRDHVIALTSKKISNVDCIVYKDNFDFPLDRNIFNDITHIIHAGAFTPKNTQQSNNIQDCFSNIFFTKELLAYNFDNLIRVVNLSSMDVYASNSEMLREESLLKPISLYGSSKLYCEEMIKCFSIDKEISFVNLRIGHVYGPGEEKYKKVLPVTIQNILEEKSLELWGNGRDLRSFIYIKDVVTSVINSLELEVENIDINVVSGISISIKDLIDKIIVISKKTVTIDRKISSHKKRDLVFDNRLLLSTVLQKETDLLEGLNTEYVYMKEKYENNI